MVRYNMGDHVVVINSLGNFEHVRITCAEIDDTISPHYHVDSLSTGRSFIVGPDMDERSYGLGPKIMQKEKRIRRKINGKY